MSLIVAFLAGIAVAVLWRKALYRLARSTMGSKHGWKKDTIEGWLGAMTYERLIRHREAVEAELAKRREPS